MSHDARRDIIILLCSRICFGDGRRCPRFVLHHQMRRHGDRFMHSP